MAERNLLYEVIRQFARIDLSPERVSNEHMGYVFEELIRIGAEQSNEEAGEHFTPREVIRLMVNLLLSPEEDLRRSHVVKTVYDPACGTGGMLSGAEDYIHRLNAEANPVLYGQDWTDEVWAICKSDMLIKGENAENIVLGDTFRHDGFARTADGKKWTFDYILANPPFGVEWKQQQRDIKRERDTLGYEGRFGAGLPRINDGALLFLQHMISKMQPPSEGGSRIAIVFNGSPLFTSDAGSGESEIRRWIIENDWLEAVVALPDQLFYNTGISTYVWVLTNKKEERRRGRVQLIDGRQFFVKMRKSLGNKRNELSEEQIADLTRIHGNFEDGETRAFSEEDPVTHQPRTRKRVVSKVFDNEDFGFHKVTVERPLRLNFAAVEERIARIDDEKAFRKLASSKKRAGKARDAEIAEGIARQEAIRVLLHALAERTGGELFRDRAAFREALGEAASAAGLRLSAPERKAIEGALSERDPEAEVCSDGKCRPEPDSELRDTETVPLKEDIEAYFEREVLPHVPDAYRGEQDEGRVRDPAQPPLLRLRAAAAPRGDRGGPAGARARDRRVARSGDRQLGVRSATVTAVPSAPIRGFPRYEAYRGSGVEWLGDVPAQWVIGRVSLAARRIQTGTTPPTANDEYYADGTVPWFGPSAFNNALILTEPTKLLNELAIRDGVARHFQAGTVMVVTIASVGKVGLITSRSSCNQQITGVTFDEEIVVPKFAAYQLSLLEGVLSGTAPAATLPILSQSDIGQLALLMPPLNEQLTIMAFLDRETARIDALIETKRLLIERLEEQRTALISRTVTRGLPPEAARAAGLDPSPRLKPSGVEWLGDVPEHWEVRKLRPLLRAPTSYGVLKPEPYDEEDSVRLLRILDIARGLQDATLMRISPAQSAEYRRTVLQEGDLVLSVVGTIGECFEVPSRLAGSNLSRALARLQLGGEITPAFLRTFFRSQSFLDWTDGIVRGTAQMVLNLGQLDGLRVPVPPVVEQRAVCAYIDTESQRLDALDGQVTSAIERLREYRTALITAAVTGKIDVQESIEEARATR